MNSKVICLIKMIKVADALDEMGMMDELDTMNGIMNETLIQDFDNRWEVDTIELMRNEIKEAASELHLIGNKLFNLQEYEDELVAEAIDKVNAVVANFIGNLNDFMDAAMFEEDAWSRRSLVLLGNQIDSFNKFVKEGFDDVDGISRKIGYIYDKIVDLYNWIDKDLKGLKCEVEL